MEIYVNRSSWIYIPHKYVPLLSQGGRDMNTSTLVRHGGAILLHVAMFCYVLSLWFVAHMQQHVTCVDATQLNATLNPDDTTRHDTRPPLSQEQLSLTTVSPHVGEPCVGSAGSSVVLVVVFVVLVAAFV